MRTDRRSLWNTRLGELARERRFIIERQFLGTPAPGDKQLLRHLDRELNYYEMALMKPAFERLEATIRARKKLARQVARTVSDLRKVIDQTGVGVRNDP